MPPIKAEGQVVLLDADNQPVTEPQPCRFVYDHGPGRYSSFSYHIRTRHSIPVPKGVAVRTVALVDEHGLVCASRVLPLSLDPNPVGQVYTIIPDPAVED